MEKIREQLTYKEGKVVICMKELSFHDQYEVLRLIMATRTKDVFVCVHDGVTPYISNIIENLSLNTTDCTSTN
jgi:hypothetical protein